MLLRLLHALQVSCILCVHAPLACAAGLQGPSEYLQGRAGSAGLWAPGGFQLVFVQLVLCIPVGCSLLCVAAGLGNWKWFEGPYWAECASRLRSTGAEWAWSGRMSFVQAAVLAASCATSRPWPCCAVLTAPHDQIMQVLLQPDEERCREQSPPIFLPAGGEG